jgi:pimeloyl-ACP methyl ester carboxylesterase
LQDLNLWAAWEKVDAPVLAIWGEHDWIMSRDDIEKIAELANRRRPGNGRFVALPRTTHGLLKNETDEYSNKNFDSGSFNSAVVPLVFDWMKSVVAAR